MAQTQTGNLAPGRPKQRHHVRRESMKQPRQRWERPDFEERPLGAEVTAYVTAPGPGN